MLEEWLLDDQAELTRADQAGLLLGPPRGRAAVR